MAGHGKKAVWPLASKITGVGAALCLAAAVVLGVALTFTGGVSRPASAQGEESSAPSVIEEKTMEDYPRTSPMDGMKAVRMTPGVDYYTDAGDTPQDVRAQIDKALASCEEWGFNAVLADMDYQGDALYPSEVYDRLPLAAEAGGMDPFAYLLEQARKMDMKVYAVLDLRIGQENGWDPATPAGRTGLRRAVDEAVAAYDVDGYFITGYAYPQGADIALQDCLTQAAGQGLVSFLRQQIDESVSWAVTAVLKEGGKSVGLLASPVWASTGVSEDGAGVSAAYQDYASGYADTRRWVQEGWFDGVMVDNAGALEDEDIPFLTVLDWWDELCGAQGLPLYVLHAAEKTGGKEEGWTSPAQLPRQYLACEQAGAWAGSVFGPVSALQKNTGKSTDVLLGAMEGTVQEEYLEDKLKVTSPEQEQTTTLESRLTLQGTADPNFPLTINGQEVEISDHGYFAKDVTLEVGENTYTFQHKGETRTYTVTYDIQVLKSVAPVRDLTLDGGTAITVSAIARKGSTVSASIGGTTVEMSPAPLEIENGSEDLSDYENYSGTYVLPAGIEGRVQSLGTVVVRGEYQGLTKTMQGGKLYVAALIPPISQLPDNGSSGTLNDSSILDPSKGGAVLAEGTILAVTAEYAETFRGSTVEDYSRPTNAYLPKGTTDVLVRQVYDSASEHYYYQLGSGRRVYVDDAKIYRSQGTLTANTLSGGQVTVDSEATAFTFGSVWKIPYNIQLLPQQYANINTTSQPSYDVSATGQTTEYVDVTFYYTDGVPAAPDVSTSPLFERAVWIKGEDHQYTLRLYLTRTAQFYGYSVHWESGGRVCMSFKHAPAVSDSATPLKGVRILIDAGHGGDSVGTAAGSLPEKTLTLQYATTLRQKLEALGASVFMTRTGDTNPTTDARMDAGRNNGTDLIISIHMDGSTSSATSGCSIHYFNEYSYLPAKTVVDKMREVEKSFGIGSRSNVCIWNPFFITRVSDAPSMLIECGFMSNPQNLEQLISSGYRSLLTQAIADGVVEYFQSLPDMPVSSSGPSGTQTTGSPTSLQSTSPTVTATPAALPPESRRIGTR